MVRIVDDFRIRLSTIFFYVIQHNNITEEEEKKTTLVEILGIDPRNKDD